MSEAFIGEIRIFPFNFAPQGWFPCDGRLLPIAQYTALFSLLGTAYGGNGKNTFALPNLQDSVPMHFGEGPGLSYHDLGETGGEALVTLQISEMPAHSHAFTASTNRPETTDPGYNYWGTGILAYAEPNALTPMNTAVLGVAGNGLPHNNMQPSLAVGFFICNAGVFPSRG